jgi:hypothetical protein
MNWLETEALEPIIKFRRYRVIENRAIREFYSLLRSTMVRVKRVGLLRCLLNDQMLPSIMAWMPLNDWKQWAKEQPSWIGGVLWRMPSGILWIRSGGTC